MTFSTFCPIPALGDLPKSEVRAYFDWILQILPERLDALPNLVRQDLPDWRADFGRASLVQLGDWFAARVQTRKRTAAEMSELAKQSKYAIEIPNFELASTTFSLAHDVGFYLGESLRSAHPNLVWRQVSGNRRNVQFGHAALVEFRGLDCSPVHLAITLAYGIAAGTKGGQGLVQIFDAWSKLT